MIASLLDFLRAGGADSRPGKRLIVIFVAGLLSGLAFAPTYLVPLWPFGFGLTLYFIQAAQRWPQRLALSFLFSYGSMLSSLYWIALAPTADPQFYFLIPPTLILLPAFAAVFGTLALFLAGFWRHEPAGFAFLAGTFWLFFEWRRGLDLTGFAWNRVGMIWTVDPVTMQLAAWGGVAALSLVSVLLGLSVFFALRRQLTLAWGLGVVPLALLIGFGALRLAAHPQESLAPIPEVKVRLVQANIPKNSLGGTAVYEAHMALSTQTPLDGISHVIWPEGSVRASLDVREDLRTDLATRLAPAPYSLVFGRRLPSLNSETQTRPRPQTHLSAYLIRHEDRSFTTYDKVSLVPFGEYIPYSSLLSRLGFSTLTGPFLDRIPGHGPKTLTLDEHTKIGVFICYDSINTGNIVEHENRPDWLVTLTEDAWYILPEISVLAKTPGPYQHLAESRLRAVEEGLSIARASNPGISLVIDPLGRQWGKRLNLGEIGSLDSVIPASDLVPIYTKIGYTTLYIAVTLLLLIIALIFYLKGRH